LFNNSQSDLSIQKFPKEVKVYRMSPSTTATTLSPSSLATKSNNLGKKVTIQLKHNGSGKLSNKNAVIINKSINSNLTGVQKLIRLQNNPSNPRSILLPVSIQDVKDLRTIKIINTSNLKSKPANIKLAAANLLQQTKQGLVQKNVLVSKDQLLNADDSFSDHTSDGESYIFEEVMKESNTVIAEAELQKQNEDYDIDEDDDCDDGEISSANGSGCNTSKMNNVHGYPKLVLTAEEKRLLAKEGITLPSNYPLTKNEERELKRIRRKIRNKISAQDSRKRKKEYVDGLEERVKQCSDENQTLLKRIKMLQNQNHNLMSQMKKLQSLLTKGTGKTAQPATCLMVLLLSMVLVAVPNIKLGQNAKESEIVDAIQNSLMTQQNRRNLLFDTKEPPIGDIVADEELNFDEIMSSFTGMTENDFSDDIESPIPNKKSRTLIDFDIDDKVWNPPVVDINRKFNDHATLYHKSHKTNNIQSSGFNIEQKNNNNNNFETLNESKLDPDIMDLMTKTVEGGFELNIDKIATLSKQAVDYNHRITIGNDRHNNILDHNGNNKKNSSAQIKTSKLILQDV
jgi:cyclic AMP-responsive element-binding protein 3